MNIRNYHKYFREYKVKTTTTHKDKFGGIAITAHERTIRGYFSKSNTNTRDLGEGIPITASGGILFTDPQIHLKTGDILGNHLQVIDFDKHPSHNEYSVKFVDKWGESDDATPTPPAPILNDLLNEDGVSMLYEDNVYMKLEG